MTPGVQQDDNNIWNMDTQMHETKWLEIIYITFEFAKIGRPFHYIDIIDVGIPIIEIGRLYFETGSSSFQTQIAQRFIQAELWQ